VLDTATFANCYDYIHQFELYEHDAVILTTASKSLSYVPHLLQIYQLLKDDSGLLELVEPLPFLVQLGPAGTRITAWLIDAAQCTQHIDPNLFQNLPVQMQHIGFTDVQTEFVAAPIGDHGGWLGRLLWSQYQQRLWGVKIVVTTVCEGVSNDEFDRVMQEWEKEMRLLSSRACQVWMRVKARKKTRKSNSSATSV
jgi:hypothetical protein